MGQVYQLLTMCSEKELNGLFDLLPVTHPAKAPYNIFRQANDTVRTVSYTHLFIRIDQVALCIMDFFASPSHPHHHRHQQSEAYEA